MDTGGLMYNRYRIFDWYLQDATNYSKTSYLGVGCGSLSVGEETEFNTDTYFYNVINIFPNSIGNTFAARVAVTTDTPIEMAIEDGTYNLPLMISESGVIIEGTSIAVDATQFHDYWLCLKGTSAKLYIDNQLKWSGEPSLTTSEQMHHIGFKNYVSGESTIYIKLLRCTYGERHPIDFDNLNFEVEVDTIDTFDSPNLKTYYNVGDKVYCRQDQTVESEAHGNKRARSFRIPLIQRQPDMPYFFFYRVRVLGENNQTSDWAYYLFDQPDNPFIFATKLQLTTVNNALPNLVVFCEENRSSYIFIKGTRQDYDGENYIYDSLSLGYWKKVNNSYFMLDPDLTDVIWQHMYEDRLPGANVYSRYNKSGNVSTILEADAIMIDEVRTKLLQTIRNSCIQLASDTVLEDNFGKKYNLSKDYFDNLLEYRYALLTIQNAYCFPGEYNWMEQIFETITGVKPDIFELKNSTGWVIWDDVDMFYAPDDEKFVLMDDTTLYPAYKEAVLYSDNELAFGFDISIYNPYDMKLPEKMVKEIITNFKPAASSANIIMHDADGREYQYPGYYGFAHYARDLYYPATFEEEH